MAEIQKYQGMSMANNHFLLLFPYSQQLLPGVKTYRLSSFFDCREEFSLNLSHELFDFHVVIFIVVQFEVELLLRFRIIELENLI